jgi:hypothetical protein
MANKGKRKRTPAPAAAPGTARRPLLLFLGGGALIAAVAAIAVAFIVVTGGGSDDDPSDSTLTAVIVDQLELTQPNPEFVAEATRILSEAGYAVDYIPGAQVTVDFYRELPERRYDLVLLRVHAGITTETDADTGEQTGTEYVSLFTGEPYSEDKYPQEQLNYLGRATYTDGGEPLFGIGPRFIEEAMDGDFGDAVVVMMGCDGLRSQRTAEAFLDRGAGAFVSWTKPVSAPHTDAATEMLLQRLLLDSLPIEEAVQQTAAELGPDPTYEGELRVLTG